MPGRRLFWRIFLYQSVVLLGLLGLVLVFFGRRVRQRHNERRVAELLTVAELTRAVFAPSLRDGAYDSVQDLCGNFAGRVGVRLSVALTSGRMVADSAGGPAESTNAAGLPELRTALTGQSGWNIRHNDVLQLDELHVAVPVKHGEDVIAAVRVSAPLQFAGEVETLTHGWLVAAFLVGAGLCALSSYVLARSLSSPLARMRNVIGHYCEGDLKRRVGMSETAEISEVALTLNRMAIGLDERIQSILRQRNEQEAVLTSMVEGVLAVDINGTVINFNQAFAELLDIDVDKVRGRTVHEVIRKTDLLKFVEATLVASGPIEGDIQLIGAEEDRFLSAHGTALHDTEGRSIGALVVLHDVTQIRTLENVRRDFVANVSHELRTPITSIKGFVETLLDGALEDTENARRFLTIILRQADRLNAIISDLLSLSRIERGGDEVVELRYDTVRPVMQSAVQMCETQAGDKRIRVDIDCDSGLKARINPQLLEQSIVNLIDNAIKYSPVGEGVQVSARAENGCVQIRVTDKGCGIEAKHLPRLFERFYRVDKARSRELGGTGLGLAIVKHIAHAHRGTVSVESVVGEGTTFTIEIPAGESTWNRRPER